MEELVRIDGDLFDISGRIREIDERYVIYRNKRLNRFEIHADGVLQIAVPFDRLDARTVELVRSTRLENASKLIAQMDAHNANLKRDREKDVQNELIARVEDVL